MTFRVPKIKSCCCFSLETGTKMIGCLQMLFFVVVLSVPPIIENSSMAAAYTLQSIIWETLFFNMGIFAVIMLYGTLKRDHHLVFPWILLQSIFMLFVVISLVGMIMYLALMDKRIHIILEVEFFLAAYFSLTILVVYNFYRELKEGNSGQI